jgi:hypothetical protein
MACSTLLKRAPLIRGKAAFERLFLFGGLHICCLGLADCVAKLKNAASA